MSNANLIQQSVTNIITTTNGGLRLNVINKKNNKSIRESFFYLFLHAKSIHAQPAAVFRETV